MLFILNALEIQYYYPDLIELQNTPLTYSLCSSVNLQRNVRSTFQADIHSLNLTWMSPACVCIFFPFLEYLLTQFKLSSQKRSFFYHEFHKWNNISIWVVTKGVRQNLDRFLAKGNYCFFVNRHSAKLSKSVTIRLSFSMNHLNLSDFFSFKNMYISTWGNIF